MSFDHTKRQRVFRVTVLADGVYGAQVVASSGTQTLRRREKSVEVQIWKDGSEPLAWGRHQDKTREPVSESLSWTLLLDEGETVTFRSKGGWLVFASLTYLKAKPPEDIPLSWVQTL